MIGPCTTSRELGQDSAVAVRHHEDGGGFRLVQAISRWEWEEQLISHGAYGVKPALKNLKQLGDGGARHD
jgi:hypothetical protein